VLTQRDSGLFQRQHKSEDTTAKQDKRKALKKNIKLNLLKSH